MMKKLIVVFLFLGWVTLGFGKPDITNVKAPLTVGVYQKYEVSFTLGTYTNPYDPAVIDVYAEFLSPEGKTFRVNAFYFEGFCFSENNRVEQAERQPEGDGWKIRFTPDAVGRWTFVIHAVDQSGAMQLSSHNGIPLAFDCKEGDAEGFVRVANTKYLKREAFRDGRRQEHGFYPIGPNVAWYSAADYKKFKKPYGIYDYMRHIDSLDGNANYFRVWLTRYQYLSLYGPEHAIRDNDGKPVIFFDSSLNQKDAAELDFIVSCAAEHGLTVMPCFFTYGDFRDDSEALESSQKNGSMPSGWRYNPYHTLLGLEHPVDFFSDANALRITRNLIRYIVARWGYATNVTSWELWNEVANIFKGMTLEEDAIRAVLDWHQQMAALIHSCDPHQHPVTTSLGSADPTGLLQEKCFEHLDLVQDHYYDNIQKASSKNQMSYLLLGRVAKMRELYPDKPIFMGEYGLDSKATGINYTTRDPKGVDMHNSLWASLFSGSMGPASFWYWSVLRECKLFGRFKPLLVFCKDLPILSDAFVPAITGEVKGSSLTFPNDMQTFYLVNASEDTLLGWCQDAAFSYQALRCLTDKIGENNHFVNDGIVDSTGYVYTMDPSKKPMASSGNDSIFIPVKNQPRGTRYQVRWFDTETGREILSEATTVVVRYRLFQGRTIGLRFPSSLRQGRHYLNTFGDAVFVLTRIERQ